VSGQAAGGSANPPSLPGFRTEVIQDWIDYNGHLSEAYYVLVFGFATDAAMDALGLGSGYRERSGCSLYTVEAHVRYLSEVGLGADLQVTTRVVGVAAKKLRLAHTMRVGGDVIATEEILGLHVDQGQGRTVPLPEKVRSAAEALMSPPPDWAGRSIAV
jgi:acyl-CoA thioester hydrolase